MVASDTEVPKNRRHHVVGRFLFHALTLVAVPFLSACYGWEGLGPGGIATLRTPVAHFPLDGHAADASGNGLDGTILGAATTTKGVAGRPATALYFDGAGAYVEFGNVDLPEAFSLAAWIRPVPHDDGGVRGGIVGKFTLPGNWEMNVNEATGQIVAHTSTTAGIFAPDPVQPHRWTHVVATYDGSSTLRIYQDGTLVATESGYAPAPSTSVLPRIGRSSWGGNPFKGAIDDVRIYDVQLDGPQVKALYHHSGR